MDPKLLDNLSLAELHQRRTELITKARGRADSLSDVELEEINAIFTSLRRRSSGPPKAGKPKSKHATILAADIGDIL